MFPGITQHLWPTPLITKVINLEGESNEKATYIYLPITKLANAFNLQETTNSKNSKHLQHKSLNFYKCTLLVLLYYIYITKLNVYFQNKLKLVKFLGINTQDSESNPVYAAIDSLPNTYTPQKEYCFYFRRNPFFKKISKPTQLRKPFKFESKCLQLPPNYDKHK